MARVRIYSGSGNVTVNGKELDAYFPNRRHRIEVLAPLVHLDLKGSYDVIAKLQGGGMSGQAGAVKPVGNAACHFARAFDDYGQASNS